MGILERFSRPLRVTEKVNAGRAWVPPIISPNAGQGVNIQTVVFSEFFAGEVGEVTRQGALMVPPIKKGRDILVGAIAGLPLVQRRGAEDVTPEWLRNSQTGVSPWHRMAATIDDLIFYDWSLWIVQRDGGGAITDALRCPFDRWQVDDLTGRITIDSQPASAEEVVMIPGNGSGGILAAGATTIKGYRALERAWIGRAQNPIPLVELHQTSDDPLTDGLDENGDLDPDAETDEIQRLIDEWAAARISPNGAVGYTPQQIELRVHGTVQTDLYVEGRNAAVLDVSRLLNLPAAILDGSMSTASLTYSTQEGKRSEFDLLSLPSWMAPIEAALSLDNVAPAGEVIRFDMTTRAATVAPATAQPLED